MRLLSDVCFSLKRYLIILIQSDLAFTKVNLLQVLKIGSVKFSGSKLCPHTLALEKVQSVIMTFY